MEGGGSTFSLVYATPLLQHQAQFGVDPAVSRPRPMASRKQRRYIASISKSASEQIFVTATDRMPSTVYETLRSVSVRLSVPARAHGSKPAAVGLLLWARPAGDIDRLLRQGGVQQVNAGSATLSAYVGSWTQTCYILIRRERAVYKNWCK